MEYILKGEFLLGFIGLNKNQDGGILKKGEGDVIMPRKISLFFGAGAELSYGLPSGGKFALDIFRMDSNPDKQNFREIRDNLNKTSFYATTWLPESFWTKNIQSFGKPHYEALVKGSLENKGYKILQYLDNFDENVGRIIERMRSSAIDINEKFAEVTGVEVGQVIYSHNIRLSNLMGDHNGLFGSHYFSAFIKVLETEGMEHSFKMNMQKIVKSILELLIGSCGENLIRCLNEGIFERNIDTIDVFDDIGGIFSLDYKRVGISGLEYIIDAEEVTLDHTTNSKTVIIEFGKMILEDIFSQALDYQELIDNNWRYVYSPKTDWAKFCRIIIFLNTAKRYIQSIADEHRERCLSGPGYYHDVAALRGVFDIKSVGTTNYNTFIQDVIGTEVHFLNGCINDMYDPYLNQIVSSQDNTHITVPFLFTQSGIKPLTSITMSKRYVNLYDEFSQSDIICVIGYGFNSDDGHINGIFRSLIEEEGKEIVILHHSRHLIQNIESVKREYQKKLRLNSIQGINIMVVDDDRRILSDQYWFEKLIETYDL